MLDSFVGPVYLVIFLAVIIGIAWLAYWSHKFDYKIEKEYLIMTYYYFRLFPVRKKIKLDSIIEAREIGLNAPYFATFKNFLFTFWWGKPSRKMVQIKKKGFFRTVIISPSNPTAFVEELKSKITLPAVSK